MTFREFAESNIVILDGGMGSLLEKYGILPGEATESWNLTHPEVIEEIHRAYFDAGSNVVNTNTFGASLIKYTRDELEAIVAAAIENAKRARISSRGSQEKFISMDIGPTGRLLSPFGDLSFDAAYESFAALAALGEKYGADLITVETVNDSYETKAALLAVKENSSLPVIVTNAYGTDGKLLSGASPEVMAAILEGMGADYIGANCSQGPDTLLDVISEIIASSSVPTVFKPNAGLPESAFGKTVYSLSPKEFAISAAKAVELGVRLVGGCCGTTPEYISALSDACRGLAPRAVEKKHKTVITSYCRAHVLDDGITLIGERINPTGKLRLRRAVEERDVDHIVGIAIAEEEMGAHALDVNVGAPGTYEEDFLPELIMALQYSTPLPLSIDTSSARAMEAALRIYNGKALINSVNGKRESMDKIFPLMKKYGGVAIALTLDESGIPKTVDGRLAIAKKILAEAERYGIDKKDIVFDPLAMAVSVDKDSATVTLECIRRIKEELGCHTSLGVSNISFGLPKRDVVNASFFAMALSYGLSAAIMNPSSGEMMKTYYASSALLGQDKNFTRYIANADNIEASGNVSVNSVEAPSDAEALSDAIVKGMGERASYMTRELLKVKAPLAIVNEQIIPALDKVGVGFEAGSVYLPGLLLAAETAKAAFEEIKKHTARVDSDRVKRDLKIVIATVRGDIHDIGKNIVKLLLENYGFEVIDLGKDVPPEKIVSVAKDKGADIIALSALMTTTVPAMEETVKLAREALPDVRIIVGGAVLNKDYAERIGADFYGKDAMSAVRYAEECLKS